MGSSGKRLHDFTVKSIENSISQTSFNQYLGV